MNLIVIALAVATVSTTVCLSSLFRPVRVLLEPVPVIGKVSRCPYCLNLWLSPVVVFIMVDGMSVKEWIVLSLATAGMASIFSYMLTKYLDLLEG